MDTNKLPYALQYTEIALIDLQSALEQSTFGQTVINLVNHALTGVQLAMNAQSNGEEALDAQIGALKLAKKVMDVQWDSRIYRVCQIQIEAAVATIKEALS